MTAQQRKVLRPQLPAPRPGPYGGRHEIRPDVRANPNTLRAYASVLDRVGEETGTRRRLAEVPDDEIADALTTRRKSR